MKNQDNSVSKAESVRVTFRVAVVGWIIIAAFGLAASAYEAAIAAWVWTTVCAFAGPPIYERIANKKITFPNWFTRGPHQ